MSLHHLLIDVDSTIPNLALMKVAGWAKANGDTVSLNGGAKYPDFVWISCIFTWNRQKALQAGSLWEPSCKVRYGGTGFDWGKPIDQRIGLPKEIAEAKPDYSLYRDDRAVGFCQRGCDRKCHFCDVWRKEGRIRDNIYTPLREWAPEGFRKIVLLDNDMALYEDWKHDEILNDSKGLKLCISQGYDVRCLTQERASLLWKIHPWDIKFRCRRLYIAWDYVGIEPYVRRAVALLREAGFNGRDILCYMIVGAGEPFEDDMHRFSVLWHDLGVLPYVMLYNNDRTNRYLNHFRRWVNKRVHKVASWEEYCKTFGLQRSLLHAV